MIQELLGGGPVEDCKIKFSVDGGLLIGAVTDGPPSCSSQSSATSSAAASPTTSTAAAAAAAATNSEPQKLRCPRCDSTNTKFCYYNNYNLTQPRHFCKTCRRYWTQGGALRNVPIGGGCRKTKSTGISLGAAKSNGVSGNKPKTFVTSDIVVGKSGLGAGVGGAMGFDHDLPSSPILWTTPHNSHLLSLLRAAQTPGINNTNSSGPSPNPSPVCSTNTNPVRIKEEGPMVGSHLVPEASLFLSAFNARNLGLDPLGQVPLGLCNSLWRSNQYQHPLQQQQQQQPQQQNNGLLFGENPTSGIQELFQRLRSTGNYYTDCPGMVLGNVGSSSTTSISFSSTPTVATATTTILEPTPVAGGELGCWNSASFAWADMPNANGAFP